MFVFDIVWIQYIYIYILGCQGPASQDPHQREQNLIEFLKNYAAYPSVGYFLNRSQCAQIVIFLPEHSCSLWVFPKDPSWDLSFFFSCFLYFNLNNHLWFYRDLLIIIFCSSSSFLLQDFVDGVWVLCVGDFLSGLRGTLEKKCLFTQLTSK